LQARIPQILDSHKIAAAQALANFVKNPSVDRIVPSPFDEGFVDEVIQAVSNV
jgi:malic enzyme